MVDVSFFGFELEEGPKKDNFQGTWSYWWQSGETSHMVFSTVS